jgi:hypothetical protein
MKLQNSVAGACTGSGSYRGLEDKAQLMRETQLRGMEAENAIGPFRTDITVTVSLTSVQRHC